MARVALVCSGGGTSASFEAGVLQELRKVNILPLISIVSGASAGALNAAAVASGQDTKLEAMWTSLTKERVYRAHRFGNGRMGAALAYLRRTSSLYDTQPLRELLEGSIDFSAIRSSSIQLRIAASDLLSGKKIVFNNHSVTLDSLMATTALLGFFPEVDDGTHMLYEK